MTLFIPRSALHRMWPWTKNVERILRTVQPRPFTGSHLVFGSDYGGDHKASKFRVYCFLIADTDASPMWPQRRHAVRQKYLADGRRISFKRLRDKRRRRALPPFLEAAESITGHLVSLVVTKELTHMSARAGLPPDLPKQLGLSGRWSDSSFEAMFRTAHIFALLLALWARPLIDVTWITDEDEIVANDARLDDIHQIAGRLTSMYMSHRMGVFAMNSTAIDSDDRPFEDLVAIPDLAAGMLSEVAGTLAVGNFLPASEIVMNPIEFSEKSQIISDWFWWSYSTLKRTCILIDRVEDGRLRSQRITMHYA